MNRNKFYQITITILIGINIVVLSFGLLRQGPKKRIPNQSIRKEIVELLQLEEDQITEFNLLADDHRNKMRRLEMTKVDLLNTYFGSIQDTSLLQQKEEVLVELQKIESEKLEVTYEHFKNFKEILNPEQASEFEIVMKKIVR